MKTLLKVFKTHHGFARMQELRNNGVQTRTIAKAVEDGIIEKIKSGLYKLIDYSWDEHGSFAEVCNSYNKAIICITSAASYYDLTTFNPSYITVAIPHNAPGLKLEYPPIQVYYFSHKYYETGINEIDTKSGLIKIYDREKTICDLFRYRKKIGDDIVIESLKNYLKQKKRDINKLIDYADNLSVKEKILPYVKAIVG